MWLLCTAAKGSDLVTAAHSSAMHLNAKKRMCRYLEIYLLLGAVHIM